MTIEVSGELQIGPNVGVPTRSIASEFGGAEPHQLSEYYRGGGLVPDVAQNAAVPTTGEIRMSNFYNTAAGNVVVNWPTSVEDDMLGITPTATLSFNTDGSVTIPLSVGSGGGTTPPLSWFSVIGGTPGNFHNIRTLSTTPSNAVGTLVSGSTVNVITPLSSNRTWTLSIPGGGTLGVNAERSFTFQILNISNVVVASRTVTIRAFGT